MAANRSSHTGILRCRWLVLVVFACSLSSRTPCAACTSLVLEGSDPVFASNYDNRNNLALVFINTRGQRKSGLSPGTTGAVLRWQAKYGSISFNVGGYQLPWAGMNEAGLMLSTMQLNESVPPPEDERPPLDYGPLWMQYVLDTCATVDEVLEATAGIRIVDPEDHYLVADRFGGVGVIEFLGDEPRVYRGDELPVAALTNSAYDEAVEVWNEALASGTSSFDHLESPFRRFCIASEFLEEWRAGSGGSAVEAGFAALAAVSDFNTQFSIVFEPGRSRVHFGTAENPVRRTVDLENFQLRCGAPVMMMDLHSGDAGEVSGLFGELSLPDCISHMESYFMNVGEDVAPGLVEAYHEVVGGFFCPDHRRVRGGR